MKKWILRSLALGLVTIGLIAMLGFAGNVAGASPFEKESAFGIASGTATRVIDFSSMAPGDTITRSMPVSNQGSIALRYAMTSATTEDTLAAQLDMTIKIGVINCTNAGFAGDGTVLYGPADLGSTQGIKLVGNPAFGEDLGDRLLTLGANEELCIQVLLPLSTGNAYQGLSTTATFDFIAEQIVNN